VFMKIRILAAALILFPGVLMAQTKGLKLNIQDAKDYALQNNKTYQNAQDDVALAETQIKEARSSGLPQIQGSLEYMTYFNYEFDFPMGGGETEPPDINYSLLDAGDFEIFKILEQFTAPSTGNTILMGDQASANVQVSQLIFSGQFWVGMELAKLGAEIQRKSLSLTALDIKQQVTNTCHLILVSEKLLDVITANEDNLMEVARHTENMYKAGLAESTDVDQIQINISQLSNSRKAMERNLELNFNMLRMLLGVDPGTPIELTESLDTILARINQNEVFGSRFNLADNLNYQIMMKQGILGEKNLSMQKWAYAPNLVGFYTYKKKLLTTAFDLSPNHAAGFTLNVPIFSSGARSAQTSRAKIELEKIKRSTELLEQQLELQRNQLSFSLNSAYENYQTQKESVDVARRLLASIQNKYQQGLISSLELTQANSNYLQAENNYLSSALELLQSKLEMDKLCNQL